MSIKNRSLFFAPMEGVTEEPYRLAMYKNFPEWDYFSTDFLRVPTVGKIKKEKILKHYGQKTYENEKWREKTIFQILTTKRAQTQHAVSTISDLGFSWLDLNLGCPSKKVNAHGGGAYLLEDLIELSKIIATIRKNFKGKFSAKIRVGYKTDDKYEEILKLLESEGVELITVHARTQAQLYKGTANWDYIKKAKETVKVPIVGNGDVWSLEDVFQLFEYSNCDGIMLGRPALKTPWLASYYQRFIDGETHLNEELIDQERVGHIQLYFQALEKEFRQSNQTDQFLLGRFKSFSRYLFENVYRGEIFRSQILRSSSLDEFKDRLYSL